MLSPGQGGVIVGVGGDVREVGRAGGRRPPQGVVEHEHEVPPADLVIPAEFGGADAGDNAVGIAVFHGSIGPVLLRHVAVDIDGGDGDGLADPSGGEGEGALAGDLGGGVQAGVVHRAHVPLRRPGDDVGVPLPQGLPAPVGPGGGELNLFTRLHSQGGESAALSRPGDGERGEGVHHVELGGPLQVAVPVPQTQGVGARPVSGGVDPVLDLAQLLPGGDGHLVQIGLHQVEPLVQGHGLGQLQGGAGEQDLTLLGEGQPAGLAVSGLVGDQEKVGGAAAGTAPGGAVLEGGPLLAGQPHGQGGGAAPIHIYRPHAVLTQQLVGQILLAQAHGVAGLPAVGGVEHQGAVRAHADGGAGLPAVGAVGPVGAVGDGPVLDQNVPHPAGPLGLGQGLVPAGGAQGDPVPHLEGREDEIIARGVVGGEDVLVRPDVQSPLSLDHLGDLQL